MSKTLTWFLSGQVTPGASQGPAFRLDDNYKVGRVWLHAGTAPSGSNLIVDINEDGTSLFTGTNPCLVKGDDTMDDHPVRYTLGNLGAGTVITMDVDAVGNGEPGRDLTVQVDLEDL